jgi:hypothetical protein
VLNRARNCQGPQGGGVASRKEDQKEETQEEGNEERRPPVGTGEAGCLAERDAHDSSGSETEEKYARFAESGRWIAEMTGIPQQTTTTSRGECSGQEKPDS